ncbi:hypothetical protein B296_00048462 [Ensete ventricosum]|uniref:Uncharacterized protein n=1 Tax=Ensete ventricosum TaxID=4639 RepID=A0A426YUM4_ENSVE|nr:hypothetical protein B296_00048462 [Ensete ventricosum]
MAVCTYNNRLWRGDVHAKAAKESPTQRRCPHRRQPPSHRGDGYTVALCAEAVSLKTDVAAYARMGDACHRDYYEE